LPTETAPPPSLTAAPPPASGPVTIVYGLDAPLPENLTHARGWPLRSFAAAVIILLCIVAWAMVTRYLATPIPIPRFSTFLAIFGIAALAWLTVRAIYHRRVATRLIGSIPKTLTPGDGRLRAVGRRSQLAALKRLGDVSDETFEPIVLLTPRIIPMPAVATLLMIASAIGFCALMELLRRTTSLPLMRPGWFTFMAGAGVGVGVQMLFWSTYSRITPGRMDIMRFTLGRRMPRTTTYDLRSAHVLAHMNKGTLFIRPGSPGAPWTALSLRGVWNPTRLVHAVMRGAASTAPTPPLPDDQLLG